MYFICISVCARETTIVINMLWSCLGDNLKHLVKVITSKILISLSFAAPMAIAGVFKFKFHHLSFLCFFDHSNYLLTMLAEDKEAEKSSTPLHTQVS